MSGFSSTMPIVLGSAVILDVVYNHLGPVGSVLHEYSDWYFAEHETEWGRGFNLDGQHSEPVRAFMRANVRHWIDEYHVDGLRFDAVHSIVDRSPEHIVHELTRHARAIAHPRRLFVVGENESQDVAFLRDVGERGPGGLDGIWNEDWHHSAFVALTGQDGGVLHGLRRHCQRVRGDGAVEPPVSGPVVFVAEAAARHRLPCVSERRVRVFSREPRPGGQHRPRRATASGRHIPARWRAMVSLLLLGPQVPMLFQGQECATTSPFTYFADHEGDLAEAVRKGRLEFLSQFPHLTDAETRERSARSRR